jgi:two-component system, chemotaxis family, CheB/CheR fusion protein
MDVSEPISEKTAGPDKDQFPVVGIGASAGGLEDQKVSKMPVHQVEDNMPLRPDSVYVIPPNKTMSVRNGILHIFNPPEARGLRLPVDFFFRSLAGDMGERSIGLILSGMGFDSMPRNAMEAVDADIVASPAELPALLTGFLKNSRIGTSGPDPDIRDKGALDKITMLLRTHTGNDFSQYKENMIYRRIERRMSIHGINRISLYVGYLQDNPGEIDILLKEMMISVTNFFRDPDAGAPARVKKYQLN